VVEGILCLVVGVLDRQVLGLRLGHHGAVFPDDLRLVLELALYDLLGAHLDLLVHQSGHVVE